MAYCNNKFATKLARIINPTIHFHIGYYQKLPYAKKSWCDETAEAASQLVAIARNDWDAYESSWDFSSLPLLMRDYRSDTLEGTYMTLRAHWRSMTEEMQRLEEENNSIFIDAYGLQDELTAEVPLEEITLTCNPAYRYGGNKTEAELEDLLRADTMPRIRLLRRGLHVRPLQPRCGRFDPRQPR